MCTSHRCWRSPCPRPDREVPGQPHSAKVPGVEQLERGALQRGSWCRNGGGVGQQISRRGLDITKIFNWGVLASPAPTKCFMERQSTTVTRPLWSIAPFSPEQAQEPHGAIAGSDVALWWHVSI